MGQFGKRSNKKGALNRVSDTSDKEEKSEDECNLSEEEYDGNSGSKGFPFRKKTRAQSTKSDEKKGNAEDDEEFTPSRSTPKELYTHCLSIYDQKASSSNARIGHTGLTNLGCTCFMNATLQALLNTHQLHEIFTVDEFNKHLGNYMVRGVVSACFAALQDCYWSGRHTVINPGIFLRVFRSRVSAELADGRQHDAHEFQCLFLEALHQDMNQVVKSVGFQQNYVGADFVRYANEFDAAQRNFERSRVNNVFNLRTMSQIICSKCRVPSITFEDTTSLSLELPLGVNTTLRECLATEFARSVLDDWKCLVCMERHSANKNKTIWKLPPVFVVHLLRFQPDESGQHYVKNDIIVNFDASQPLNLGEYVHLAAPTQKAQYTLYAITNHSGTLDGGHYTAYIRNLFSNEWLLFDDDSVYPVSEINLVSQRAYILYFTNQNPLAKKSG